MKDRIDKPAFEFCNHSYYCVRQNYTIYFKIKKKKTLNRFWKFSLTAISIFVRTTAFEATMRELKN